MDHLLNILHSVRARLWLVPAIACAAAAGLAWFLMFSRLQVGWLASETQPWWLFSGDVSTGRDLLASLLSGMITMTSLVVSITMVVLALAAGQLGPRLIRTFMRDRAIQAVIGLFFATILYALLVLRSITGDQTVVATLHVAVTVATGLVILCLFALLFYLHKLVRSTNADVVINLVANQLDAAADRLSSGQRYCDDRATWQPEGHAFPVSLPSTGYLQVIQWRQIAQLAEQQGVHIRLNVRPGDFLLAGGAHVDLFAAQAPAESVKDRLRRHLVIGSSRTETQDLEFMLRQLVEISLRALSRGINDPFTAIAVVNRLGSFLARLNRPSAAAPNQPHTGDELRVHAVRISFEQLLNAAFDPIRSAAADNRLVLEQMINVIGDLAPVCMTADSREALSTQLSRLEFTARRRIDDPADLNACLERANAARAQIDAAPPALM